MGFGVRGRVGVRVVVGLGLGLGLGVGFKWEGSPILPAGGAACTTSRETVTSSGERRPERILTWVRGWG